MLKLLLFTNSKVLERGFLSIFTSLPAIQIHTVHGVLEDILRALKETAPDLVLFDFTPGDDFVGLTELRRRAPGVNIVLWVEGISMEAGYQAMKLGVRGILRKSEDTDMAVAALTQVAEGQLCFDRALITDFLESRTVGLTPRESQLVPLVARGLKNKEIASALELSGATVRVYLSALFRKLGVRNRNELAIHALKNLPCGALSMAAGAGRQGAGPVLHSMLMGKARTTTPCVREGL